MLPRSNGVAAVPEPGADPATLPKAQERTLRSALRKIRNKVSAEKSRQNQRDYIVTLEEEAAVREMEVEVRCLAMSLLQSSSVVY